jgi:lysophospholipase L1-like esterase
MKSFFIILSLFIFHSACEKKTIESITSNERTMPVTNSYTYLALGDSYTIGESVLLADNFPNQTVSLLKAAGKTFVPARIVAKTGWTTDELETGIALAQSNDLLLPQYDFVSLLIGVNNQYRGRPVEQYKTEFEMLLQKAIRFAGNNAAHVVVVSIPDWGVTPFANGRDRGQIAAEIDAYNAAAKQVALQYQIHFIDITPWTREAATDNTLLAADGLHPSGKEYARWAEKVAEFFKSKL